MSLGDTGEERDPSASSAACLLLCAEPGNLTDVARNEHLVELVQLCSAVAL